MEEINITELLQYYLKKLPIIIIITLLTLLLGAFYIKRIQVPLYHGTTTIILVQKSEDNQSANATQNELNVNERLVTTYSQIIKSRRVLDQVIDSLKLELETDELAEKITVTSVSETPIIKVSVSDENPEDAMVIANELAEVFKKEITKIYNLENISVVDKAILEDKPYNINITKQMVIYGLAGFVLSCGIIFIIYYFDNTIKNKKEIETKLNIPVLSEIPLAKLNNDRLKQELNFNKVYEKVKKKKGVKQ